MLAACIRHRVDVELRSFGFAGEFAEPLDKLFLEIIIDVVLLAEEDDATLRDWRMLMIFGKPTTKHTGDG